MAKPVKTQWDFGELFPVEQPRRILSVSELTLQIRRLLEKQLGQVWVMGEITNLRLQSSGHIYFTLKDASAQLNCVLFRGENPVDRSLLQDGRKVTLRGDLTVYEPRGQYQLRVLAIELQGIGALQAAFEKLKQKLKTEGLFAPERKRSLPRYPQSIGVVTSPSGAALRDVLHVVQRRNPALRLILAPCRVQGEGAAEEIAASIRLLNQFHGPMSRGALDLILLTRGGGSLEDLWAFNEEIVARAIFESALPVVSAIGHEIDFTISDFVADVRAATPSAAAEIITEGVFASCQFLTRVRGRLRQELENHLADKLDQLTHARQRLARFHPRRQFNAQLQRLDDLQSSLQRCVRQSTRHQRLAWQNLSDRLARLRPALLVKQRRELFHQTDQRFRDIALYRIRDWKNRLESHQSRLALLGPSQVLARGYSITLDVATGSILRRAEDTQPGQVVKTLLKSGAIQSRVEAQPARRNKTKAATPSDSSG